MKNGKRQPNKFADETGKVCGSCEEYKKYSEYYKAGPKAAKGAYRTDCKKCMSAKTKARRLVDGDRMKEISKKSREKHKHNPKHKERERQYYLDNKEKYRERYDRYMQDSEKKQNRREVSKAYYKKNKERLIAQNVKKSKERYHTDPIYKMINNVRGRLRYTMESRGLDKFKSTVDLVGCEWPELWNHLCATFEANYGMPREWLESIEYEIDHIIPMCLATTEEDVMKLSHYSNLQLLTKEDNREKSNNIGWEIK